MKSLSQRLVRSALTLCFGVLSTSLATAVTLTVESGQSLLPGVNNSFATYGPPPAVHFTEPGPVTVDSGLATTLWAGPTPGQANVEYLLFVLSCTPASWQTLSSSITFNALGIGSASEISSFTFGRSDFFSPAASSFPDHIGGIANGEVNEIKFPDAYHAAVKVSGFDFGGISPDTLIANISVLTPVDLRIDIFGVDGSSTQTITERILDHYQQGKLLGFADANGNVKKKKDGTHTRPVYEQVAVYRNETHTITVPAHMVNNTPNSGALGVRGEPVPDAGTTALLLGMAITGVGLARRFCPR